MTFGINWSIYREGRT